MNTIKDRISTLVFYLSILFFIIGFQFSDTPLNGWYQQFMPSIGGRQISDVFFLDSLTGWAVTPFVTQNDTTYVIKTTNSGNNWFVQFTGTAQFAGMKKIRFINSITGYCCGNYLYSGSTQLVKTTSGGNNWSSVNTPDPFFVIDDMYVLNENTIWLAVSSSATGGVFRTTNGGGSWDRQLNLGSQNPNHIYMFNGSLGFICKDNVYLRRTTNSGLNWDTISGAGGFLDMYFADSLTGWKTSMQKTTDGGLTWVNQILPQGGNIITSQIRAFSNVNRDTIWGVGGTIISGSNGLGMIYRTLNGGDTWMFQTADTSIHFFQYFYNEFINNITGWAYVPISGGVHTTTGGDPIFYTGTRQINLKTPDDYKLAQNYPNPFNLSTIIRFQILRLADIKLMVFDVTGKEMTRLAEKEYKPGTYELIFDGSNYSSGIYFYSLFADGKLVDTKKMILIK